MGLLARHQAILADLEGTSARLIAVSKGQPAELIQKLYEAGQRDFGENYAQELLEKIEFFSARGITGIVWHFLGHLQTNKVKAIIPYVTTIHSVNSERLALEISKRAEAIGRRVGIFVEVNVDQESTKSGVLPADLPGLLAVIGRLPAVDLMGLMCIPSREGGLSGRSFAELRRLRDLGQAGAGQLSMGMSEDYPVAAREGSSWVRVGTALFGPRNG